MAGAAARFSCRSRGWVLSLWAFGLAGAAAAQTGNPAPSLSPAPQSPALAAMTANIGVADRVLPLDVVVNGAKQGSWLLLERVGKLYAPMDAFDEWRLQARPDAQTVVYKGTTYVPLASVPGFTAKVDFSAQAVDLTFSPQAFVASRLTTELSKRPDISPVLPSAFVNYDLNYTRVDSRQAPSSTDLGLLTELGLSTGLGVLTSTFAGRGLAGASSTVPPGWVRLETTLTRDFPDRNRTLRLGDASTRPGVWGRNVYFGGIQLGTNYGLTPGFITQANPVLGGVSSAPSTVELYVNDVLRQVSSVPSGPFVIDNYGALAGGGEARVVVRDLLGRETVVTQPFFTTKQLLAENLDDWSFEAGRLRENLGFASSLYGERFAALTWNRGLTHRLTMEARTELSPSTKNVGLSVIGLLPGEYLGTAGLVTSTDAERQRGHEWLLGLQRQTLRLGAYLQAQGASAEFRQLGQTAGVPAVRLQLAGNLTYTPPGNRGTFGIGFANLARYGEQAVRTVSASYSTRVGEKSSLVLTASRALAGVSGNSVSANLMIPLEGGLNLGATAATHDGKRDAYLTATSNPGGDGLGWRVLGGQQSSEQRAEANTYYQGRYGRLSADLSNSSTQTATRVGASGGFVIARSQVFATRRVEDSYALVEVPGYKDVGVGLGSNVLTRTDSDGVALVPRLMAYQRNSIRVDPADLPISAELDSIEQTAVPSWRSAVLVKYPVRSGRGALLKIRFDDGEDAPAGATVRIEGDREDFYVARHGEAFVTGLDSRSKLRLTWRGKQCTFAVTLPGQDPNDIPRIGPIACQGVPR